MTALAPTLAPRRRSGPPVAVTTVRDDGSAWINLGDKFAGSGGASKPQSFDTTGKIRRLRVPFEQSVGGLRPKSRMELPHRFALGCQWPAYRRFEEEQAGLEPTVAAPQWILRMDVVWAKPNGMPESVTDRCRASHEYWLHLVKSERYFAAIDEVREPHKEPLTAPQMAKRMASPKTSVTHGGNNGPGRNNGAGRASTDDVADSTGSNPLGKVPGSVWSVATEPLIVPPELGVDHFAAFPSEFPRRIVLGWSPSGVCVACGDARRPVVERTRELEAGRQQVGLGRTHDREKRNVVSGGPVEASSLHHEIKRSITGYACSCPTPDAPTRPSVVLDPFSGTGTTAVVAAALGRHGIGVELSADYLRLARWRDEDGGLRCKALGVEKPARQLDGQLSLLGGVL